MIFLLLLGLLVPACISADDKNYKIAYKLANDPSLLTAFQESGVLKGGRVDNSLIDARITSIVDAFNAGLTRTGLLEKINFEHLEKEFLQTFVQESKSENSTYGKSYWEKNPVMKSLLENPNATMYVPIDAFPDLSYSVTMQDVLKKAFEHKVYAYAYTLLYQQVKNKKIYDTNDIAHDAPTFSAPATFEKRSHLWLPTLDAENNNGWYEITLPDTIIPLATKNAIGSYIQTLPKDSLIPYTDGLYHYFSGMFSNHQQFRKTFMDYFLLPVFAKESNKLLFICVLLNAGTATQSDSAQG